MKKTTTYTFGQNEEDQLFYAQFEAKWKTFMALRKAELDEFYKKKAEREQHGRSNGKF